MRTPEPGASTPLPLPRPGPQAEHVGLHALLDAHVAAELGAALQPPERRGLGLFEPGRDADHRGAAVRRVVREAAARRPSAGGMPRSRALVVAARRYAEQGRIGDAADLFRAATIHRRGPLGAAQLQQ